MKLPRPKIHIVDTAIPLLSYSALSARCGTHIANGEPKFMFSEETPKLYQVGTCLECRTLRAPDGNAKRYEYGICEAGQES